MTAPIQKRPKAKGRVVRDDASEVVIRGVSYPVNTTKRSGINVEWFKRMVDHLEGMNAIYPRMLVVRFDLHLSEHTSDNAVVDKFRDAMKLAVKRKYGCEMGYVWCRELGKDKSEGKSQHYHWIVIVDADRVKFGPSMVELAVKIWEKDGRTVGFCKAPWKVIGPGSSTLEGSTHWLSYLAKERGKQYLSRGAQDFSTGQRTIEVRDKKKGQIVKVTKVPQIMRKGAPLTTHRPIGIAGLTVGEFRLMGFDVVAAQSWGKVGGLKVVAQRLGIAPATVRAYVKKARPGELENANKLREARQEVARLKGIAMLRNGATRQEVAEALGVGEVTPWNWIEKTPDLAAQAQAKRDARAALEQVARDRLLAGEGSTALAKELGINRKVMVRLTKELGLNRKRPATVTPELRARALAMREAGATVGAIGEAVGVDPSTVAKWAKAAGL